MSLSKKESPYLSNPQRLSDVIAAIQAMATYRFYKLDFESWSYRITGTEKNAVYWKNIITEHPEFFRLDNNGSTSSLIWRRNGLRRYHVDLGCVLSESEYSALNSKEQSERVSRVPLSSPEISILVNTAIDLHSRELEEKRENRWIFLPLFGLFGVIIGAAIKTWT